MDGAKANNSLGKYRLLAELGHGGMAEVFLSVVRGPAGFNKLVVIKQIRPQLAEDPEFLNMFLDEARLAARLSHPNVVQTNEVGQEQNRYFIAMEYLEGQPLNRVIHRLARTGGLPLVMHLRILIDVLGGLHHAHDLADFDGTPLNVVHRDVTPHNVFVTYDGVVKVVDFGIAKAMNSSAETRTGVLKGKVAYMAPEQARGERVDRRADVFSVGIMLWEAATGKRLWKGIPDITILQRLLASDIPSVRSVKHDVDPRLEAIVQKAMAQDREQRFETAADMQSALEDLVRDMGEHIQTRDIGKLVAQAFEADRAKIKAIIDEQLRAKPTEVVALPSIDPRGTLTNAERVSLPTSSDSQPSASSRVESADPRSASYTGPSALFASTSASQAGDGRSRRGLLAGGAVALGAAAALAFWVLAKGPASEQHASANAASATASVAGLTDSAAPKATPAAVPPKPTETELRLAIKPGEAKIFLDDKPLDKNPYTGKHTRDGAEHKIRIEAAGHKTRDEVVRFDKDVIEKELVLEREPSADTGRRRQGPAPAGAPAPQPPPDDGLKPSGPKPKRNIDPNNPYDK